MQSRLSQTVRLSLSSNKRTKAAKKKRQFFQDNCPVLNISLLFHFLQTQHRDVMLEDFILQLFPHGRSGGGSSKRSSQSHALGMPWSSVGHRCGKSEVLFHISSDTLWLKSPLADLITLPCLLRTAQHRVQTTLLTLQMKTRCGRNWLAFLDRPTMPQLKIKGFSFN